MKAVPTSSEVKALARLVAIGSLPLCEVKACVTRRSYRAVRDLAAEILRRHST